MAKNIRSTKPFGICERHGAYGVLRRLSGRGSFFIKPMTFIHEHMESTSDEINKLLFPENSGQITAPPFSPRPSDKAPELGMQLSCAGCAWGTVKTSVVSEEATLVFFFLLFPRSAGPAWYIAFARGYTKTDRKSVV